MIPVPLLKFATALAARHVRTSGSRHWRELNLFSSPCDQQIWSLWGAALRRNWFVKSLWRFEDYRLVAAVGIFLGAYLGLATAFYWMMQPTVAANSGVAAYRPPPKTVVHDANSPWVPPAPAEAPPLKATAAPEPEFAAREPMAESKKQTRKREGRTIARQPARQQQNPFWGYASSRSGGSRPWF